jgi:hypothetical protein
MFKELKEIVNTPCYGRIGGLRVFNADDFATISLTKWQCPDWEKKVGDVNAYFEALGWVFNGRKISHAIVRDGELYAKWFFSFC